MLPVRLRQAKGSEARANCDRRRESGAARRLPFRPHDERSGVVRNRDSARTLCQTG